MRCVGCRLVRLSPRPDEESLGYYYPDDYYSFSEPSAELQGRSLSGWKDRSRAVLREAVLSSIGYDVNLNAWQRLARPLLKGPLRRSAPYGLGDRFPPYRAGGKALDIGCGNGLFLSYLKSHGWQVQGVDLSPVAAEVAGRLFNIDVFVGRLEQAPFEQASFDFINLMHLIEHVPDPALFMQSVAGLLKPGGAIYLETPNAESYGCQRAGPYWVPWEAPRHLYLFSPQTLRRLFELSSMQILRMKTTYFGHYDWESTYKREEQEGQLLDPRPQLGFFGRISRTQRSIECRVHRWFDPMSDEIVQCWAVKR